ncbi:hypothetical protein CDL12_24159 [Handroanthus impetiginosus]|uniref:Uncharacterized protein n=1 Tax=Handroanthus impetiginosus TaxID=429701 RepID=A0A2G9GDG1_9LAMI|nr:hypothetical protein CDL12_24159 [Handroanthus impetiginosus]
MSQNFPLEKKEVKEGTIKLENQPETTSDNPSTSQQFSSEFEQNLHIYTDRQKEECSTDIITAYGEENVEATLPIRESEESIPEDDDGFRTPTSFEHRIPAITQCPPAPKKIRAESSHLRRRAPPPASRRSLQFDLSSTEVESNFPLESGDYNVEEQKTKRIRRDDKTE